MADSVSDPDYYIFTLTGWCSADVAPTDGNCDSNTSQAFRMLNVKNPNLLTSNISPLSWKLLTATSLGYFIDGKNANLKPTPALEGVNITIVSIQIDSLTVRTSALMTWTFTPNSNLPATSSIALNIPEGFSLPTTPAYCQQILPANRSLSCSVNTNNGFLTSVVFTNPCNSTNCTTSTLLSY